MNDGRTDNMYANIEIAIIKRPCGSKRREETERSLAIALALSFICCLLFLSPLQHSALSIHPGPGIKKCLITQKPKY